MIKSKRRARLQADPDEATINLTPLLDVVFNVLIMFMVVAPMLQIDQVQLAIGERDSLQSMQEANKKHPISIIVRQDNTIWIGLQQMSMQQLRSYLIDAKKEHPHTRPLLLHDRNATFGTYQTVKDLIEKAGYEELDVLLKP